jgi:hypothetical protein
MRILKLLVAMALLCASASFASPLCTSGTLAAYETAGFSCYIGNLLFSNFSYTPSHGGSASDVLASSITVDPIFATPSNHDVGLRFTSTGWSVNGGTADGASIDSNIEFKVSTVNGQATIEDASMALLTALGLPSWTTTGDSAYIDIGETVIDSNGNQLATLDVNGSGFGSTTSDHQVFGQKVKSLSVSKDMILIAGPDEPGANASISAFEERFSEFGEVPEPGTTTLIGAGLLAVGFWRRSRRA